jgi:hypothetical protein
VTDTEGEGTRSIAWRYGPFRSKIGVLALVDEHLSFVEGDDVVFDAPLSDVQVEGWPSYGVAPNSQVKLRVGGKKHRICFVMPSNSKEAAPPSGELEMPGERRIERLARSAKTYKVGEELGGAWRKLLGG